jgi:hypothetical protein
MCGPIVVSGTDWRNWFLFPHELEVVTKYDWVICVVEYASNPCRGLYADIDSVRVGMLYLCCEHTDGFIAKLGSKFDTDIFSDWSDDIEEIRQKWLTKKFDDELLPELDNVIWDIFRRNVISCFSFFCRIDRAVTLVFRNGICMWFVETRLLTMALVTWTVTLIIITVPLWMASWRVLLLSN